MTRRFQLREISQTGQNRTFAEASRRSRARPAQRTRLRRSWRAPAPPAPCGPKATAASLPVNLPFRLQRTLIFARDPIEESCLRAADFNHAVLQQHRTEGVLSVPRA